MDKFPQAFRAAARSKMCLWREVARVNRAVRNPRFVDQFSERRIVARLSDLQNFWTIELLFKNRIQRTVKNRKGQ